jgi:type II secretory pathway component PulJ
MALALAALLLVLCIGFLSQRAAQNRAAKAEQSQLQAAMLAQAGLNDAALKLGKRIEFPPKNHELQTSFEYRSTLTDASGNRLGDYLVVLDLRYMNAPYWIVRVSSTGVLGDALDPSAAVTLQGEFDVSIIDRATWGTVDEIPNPHRFQWLTVGPPP